MNLSQNAHAEAVRSMFSGIAGKYDFLNHFLSLNIDKRWRKRVARILAEELATKDGKILDVACGTGDLSIELAETAEAKIFGSDFCRPMLDIAFDKNERSAQQIPYTEGDGLNLPYAEATFNAVTIAFGLRNFSDWKGGVIELCRVLKPGGKLVVLEFSSPIVPGFKQLFNFYFANVLPRIGGIVSGSRGAYEYLPDSVSRFPDQKALAAMFQECGLDGVKYENLTGGIAAIHYGTKRS